MAFGPIMRFKVGELDIELAPLTRDSMSEFVNLSYGGGMQRHQVTRYLGRHQAPTVEDEHEWFDKTRATKNNLVWGIWVIDGNELHAGFCKNLGGDPASGARQPLPPTGAAGKPTPAHTSPLRQASEQRLAQGIESLQKS